VLHRCTSLKGGVIRLSGRVSARQVKFRSAARRMGRIESNAPDGCLFFWANGGSCAAASRAQRQPLGIFFRKSCTRRQRPSDRRGGAATPAANVRGCCLRARPFFVYLKALRMVLHFGEEGKGCGIFLAPAKNLGTVAKPPATRRSMVAFYPPTFDWNGEGSIQRRIICVR